MMTEPPEISRRNLFLLGAGAAATLSWPALAAEPNADARVRQMFEMAFARLPSDAELAGSRAYLADLAREHGEGKDKLIWRDYAQSLFNLKEFIYVR
jgi:hypothetical protein